MSFLKSEKVIGWAVVTFTMAEEGAEIGFEREDGSFGMALPGHVRESDHFIIVETTSGTFHIPIYDVNLIISFKDKDELDDHMLHSEIAAFGEENSG